MDKEFCTFGEAEIAKEGRKGTVLDRGITMMLLGCSEVHTDNVFQMYSTEKRKIVQTRDLIWLGRILHTRQDADLMQQLPIVTVPIGIHGASDSVEILKLEVAIFSISEERGVENKSSLDKADEWIRAKTRYGCKIGKKDGLYNPSTGTTI
jgi:hypothetical protein